MYLRFGYIHMLVLCTAYVDDNVINLDFILVICSFGLLCLLEVVSESTDCIVEVQLVDSTLTS